MIKKNLTIWLFIALIGIIVLGYILNSLADNPFGANLVPIELTLKASKDRILFNRETDWFIYDANGIVIKNNGKIMEYLYASQTEIPLAAGEDISKRTKNSQFFPNENGKMTAKFYAGEPFYKDSVNNKWYQTEMATTSITAFNAQMAVNWLDKIRGKKVLAETISPFAGAGDGKATNYWGAWATIHDAATGAAADNTETNIQATVNHITAQGGWNITRGFFPFDTSSLPPDSNISSSTIYLSVFAKTDGDNDAQAYVNVVQTTQPSNTAITTADYNEAGATSSPITGASNEDITNISTTGYTAIALNSNGLGWIKRSGETSSCGATNGWTCLGIREGHDIENSSNNTDTLNRIVVYSSEQTGTSNDPYLVVEYTIPTQATESIYIDEW